MKKILALLAVMAVTGCDPAPTTDYPSTDTNAPAVRPGPSATNEMGQPETNQPNPNPPAP